MSSPASILFEEHNKILLLKLNRPEHLNALSSQLIDDLNKALRFFENSSKFKVAILTGEGKAFAAGADIEEMRNLNSAQIFQNDFIEPWEYITKCRKPIIAAVNGFAFGGGCELAMMCDFIIASDTAQFAQPEIKLGIPPGAGATQRLARLIGRGRAMEMCLSGRSVTAYEACDWGLVNKVVASQDLLPYCMDMAKNISSYSAPVLQMIKECVNRADETFLKEGVKFERRLFQAAFGYKDQKEGMAAFLEKRKPNFQDM